VTLDARRLIETGPHISVGLLAADLLRLGDELGRLGEAGINLVHVDVMDGRFCPQLTLGPAIVRAIPDRFVKDVHLMVDDPLPSAHAYVEAGASILTFHVEATRHPHRMLQSLADTGVIRGVAINPGTPLAAVEPLLGEAELLLVLAVNPGWSGQTFISGTAERLRAARALLGDRDVILAVDGGITRANVGDLQPLGVDLVVAGSAVFDGGDATANARSMLEALRHGQGAVHPAAHAATGRRT